jgi:uncharacterized protein YacL (UPF0231 family)
MTQEKKIRTNDENEISKEERIQTYVKSLHAIEEAMEPFKEQKRSLKGNYVENGWLNKDDISLAVKAYRLLKNDVDMEQLMDYYDTVKRSKKGVI